MADDTQSSKWLWWFGAAVVAITAASICVVIWVWDPPSDGKYITVEQMTAILKLAGSSLVVFGIGVAVWRSRIADKRANAAARQAKSTENQIELATKEQYSERFVAAVGQVANEELAIRLGGLASLDALSSETADEYERVWNYLGNFLRYPPALKNWRSEEEDKVASRKTRIGKRPDIAAIAGMIRSRSEEQKKWGKKLPFPLASVQLQGADLRRADLQGANLQETDLQGANLRRADLQDANLQEADLQDANLQEADLQDANLQEADLQDGRLQDARLQGANLQEADLQDANLQEADLRRANLQHGNLQFTVLRGANLQFVVLQGADLRAADLQGAVFGGALFGSDSDQEQDLRQCKNLTPNRLQGTWYEQGGSAPILPDGWPEDCKPRPIKWEEWSKMRDEFMKKLLEEEKQG